jgi:hypothetical protein
MRKLLAKSGDLVTMCLNSRLVMNLLLFRSVSLSTFLTTCHIQHHIRTTVVYVHNNIKDTCIPKNNNMYKTLQLKAELSSLTLCSAYITCRSSGKLTPWWLGTSLTLYHWLGPFGPCLLWQNLSDQCCRF